MDPRVAAVEAAIEAWSGTISVRDLALSMLIAADAADPVRHPHIGTVRRIADELEEDFAVLDDNLCMDDAVQFVLNGIGVGVPT